VKKLNKKKVKWIIKQLQKGTKVSEIVLILLIKPSMGDFLQREFLRWEGGGCLNCEINSPTENQ